MQLRESDGQTRRHAHLNHPPKPPAKGVAAAFAIAVYTLFPSRFDYLGRRATMLKTLHNRVTWSALQHWFRGRRKPPQWAIELLRDEIARRRAALDHADALLAAEQNKKAPD